MVESPSKRPLKALQDWLAYYHRPLKDPGGARYLNPDNEDPIDEFMALGTEGQQKDFLTNFVFDNSARFLRSGFACRVPRNQNVPLIFAIETRSRLSRTRKIREMSRTSSFSPRRAPRFW